MTETTVLSMTELSRRVGLSPPIIRGLEAAGIVHPRKTGAGWRIFSPEDEKAARKWKSQQAAKRRADNEG